MLAADPKIGVLSAYQLLRGLTYLQTLTGPKAGEVVLWMQPDGTVNPNQIRPESPNPSDSGASYWLAHTLWALGEDYAAFQHADPDFAAFLKTRMDLAVTALQRDVLSRCGITQIIHSIQVTNWLIVNGVDASSEATLGLSAYRSPRGRRRRCPAAYGCWMRHQVTDADTAVALGSGDVPVLGTPRLIAWMEAATVQAVTATLNSGQTTVGTAIRIEHRRATPVGGSVEITATPPRNTGSRPLTFEVVAVDGSGQVVAAGQIDRVIVDRTRFLKAASQLNPAN